MFKEVQLLNAEMLTVAEVQQEVVMQLDLTARLDLHHLPVPIIIAAEADLTRLRLVVLLHAADLLQHVVVQYRQEHKAEAVLLLEVIIRQVAAAAQAEAIARQVVAVAQAEATVRQVVAAAVRAALVVVAAQVAAAVALLVANLAGEVNKSYINLGN